MIKYEPYKNEIDVSSNPFKRYYGNPLRERLGSLHGDFDNDKASLVLQNITEEDDDMQIFCEIHWGNLYGESYGKVSLAKNGSESKFNPKPTSNKAAAINTFTGSEIIAIPKDFNFAFPDCAFFF